MRRIKVILSLCLLLICALGFAQTASDYRKAAEQGDAIAQCNLGACYANGEGVLQDYSQAIYWYEKAAEQEIAEAQFNLGMLFYMGKGIKTDNNLANFWLGRAVKNPNLKKNARTIAENIQIKQILDAKTEEAFWYTILDSYYMGHEYIELGLSVKWATCNIGSDGKPENYGNYYAWGETHTKSNYDWSTYKWCNGRYTSLTKYNFDISCGIIDNKRILDLNDDIANIHWGGEWRMPTNEEVEELMNNSKCEITKINGVRGVKFISIINGNSIFLPFAGGYDGVNPDEVGSMGYYWSSSMLSDSPHTAILLHLDSNSIETATAVRYFGLPVRPVMGKKTAQSTPSSSNTLNPSEKVYSSTEVDVAPKFNGGDMGEFTKWVNQNVVYPDIAKQYDIKGRVITKFTIHSNGQISDIQILKGVDPSLDKEAINVLKKAPTLTPAKKGGENVAMSYMLPIDFGR